MSSYSPEQELSKNDDGKHVCLIDAHTAKSFDMFSIYLRKKHNITYQTYLVNQGLAKKEDYLECKECGLLCKSIPNHINIYHKGEITKQEYIDKWKPLKTIADTTFNRLSELSKGENNAMHSSKTTELQRQQNSPFSKEFYRLRNPELSEEELEKIAIEFNLKTHKDTIQSTSLEYFLLKTNGNEEEARKLQKERQTTFSKQICIEKYGETEGLKRFNDRTEKWIDSTNNNGNMKNGFSRISQELFDKIKEHYPENELSNIFYATHQNEVRLSSYKYDFTDEKNKKIIEFNGDIYHANPKMFEKDECPHPYRKETLASEIWKLDEDKKNVALLEGYVVLVVWEGEYKDDNLYILNKCLEFLGIKKCINL